MTFKAENTLYNSTTELLFTGLDLTKKVIMLMI